MKVAYDIRGKYPEELNETIAYKAGRACAIFLKAKKIVVGRDCRVHSLALKKSLIYGILDQGCDAIDIGLCSTPVSYYAAIKNHSLMITASHNPKEYNGIKITRKGVESIGASKGLNKIVELMGSCHFPEPKKRGKAISKNILPEYVRAMRAIAKVRTKPLRVLIDDGNGMAAWVVPKLLKGLSVKWKLLHGKLDGTFPNHTPNPSVPKNTKDLQLEIKKGKWDLGIAYDADCDRVFFIDELGKRVRPEFALLLMADRMLRKGDALVYTINSSRIIRDVAREKGWKAIASPIGHSEIPAVMKKNKAVIGGEITGHYYFKEFSFADNGDLAALHIMTILSQSGKKMSELIAPYKKYATSEELNYKVKDKQAVLKRIRNKYKKQITSELDGLTIDAGEYWFNIR
ncbi:phosphomannomutase/phosphoglucomutase, partial [Candidatus Woesearchaeota archaeon]